MNNHNPNNDNCPLNDIEAYAPPVFGNVTCNCSPPPPKLRVKVQITQEQIPYRRTMGSPMLFAPGTFDLEVISIEGPLPSNYKVGSILELVLDEQA